MGRKSKYSADFKLMIIHEAETSGITRTSKKTSIDFFYILINYMISSATWRRKNFLTVLWNRWTFTIRSSQMADS